MFFTTSNTIFNVVQLYSPLVQVQKRALFRRVQNRERERKTEMCVRARTGSTIWRNYKQDKLNFKRMNTTIITYYYYCRLMPKRKPKQTKWFLSMSLDQWRIIIQFNAQTVLAVPVIFGEKNSEGPIKQRERMGENRKYLEWISHTRERERHGILDTFILIQRIPNNMVVVAERDPGFALRIYVVGKKKRVIGKNPCTEWE